MRVLALLFLICLLSCAAVAQQVLSGGPEATHNQAVIDVRPVALCKRDMSRVMSEKDADRSYFARLSANIEQLKALDRRAWNCLRLLPDSQEQREAVLIYSQTRFWLGFHSGITYETQKNQPDREQAEMSQQLVTDYNHLVDQYNGLVASHNGLLDAVDAYRASTSRLISLCSQPRQPVPVLVLPARERPLQCSAYTMSLIPGSATTSMNCW